LPVSVVAGVVELLAGAGLLCSPDAPGPALVVCDPGTPDCDPGSGVAGVTGGDGVVDVGTAGGGADEKCDDDT
jgi:hypothetical protein